MKVVKTSPIRSRASRILIAALVLLSIVPTIQSSEGIPSRGPGNYDALYSPVPVVMDGALDIIEWYPHIKESLMLNYTTSNAVLFYLKENGTSLLLCFETYVPSQIYYEVMICIDTLFDKSTSPQSDDLQLMVDHSSVREWIGSGGSWFPVSPTGWSAASSPTCIEISIDYAKLGITPGQDRTLGFSFMYTADYDHIENGMNIDFKDPSTWGSVESSDHWTIRDPLFVTYGESPVTVDGVRAPLEWDDAVKPFAYIPYPYYTFEMFLKHDEERLYIAFSCTPKPAAGENFEFQLYFETDNGKKDEMELKLLRMRLVKRKSQ